MTEPTQSDSSSFATEVAVSPALISWKKDEQGVLVPVSKLFGDVYYSLADGLAESRYVFIEHNKLSQRFATLFEQDPQSPTRDCFTIAELGFGTGLNILATWQLWDKLQSDWLAQRQSESLSTHQSMPRPRLHFISTEKYPLSYSDLALSLANWRQREPSLAPFITKLLSLYPTLTAGCHRLHLADDVTLDLWLGDAATSLTKLDNSPQPSIHSVNKQPYVDAWFLDGFAPSCNESLWAQQIFEQIKRLSRSGTTAATFSCAGVVKRGLQNAGFSIQKVKGFGHKREMLTATMTDDCRPNVTEPSNLYALQSANHASHVAVIGAGISGLMVAWKLAQRGMRVSMLDKAAPLAGASGNPRALLAPKMTPLKHVDEHLHSLSYLYSRRFYRQLNDTIKSTSPSQIFEPTATLDLMLKANINTAQVNEYPESMAKTLTPEQAQQLSGLTTQSLSHTLYLPQAGLVNPKALADTVLAHSNIQFVQAEVNNIITHVAENKTAEGKVCLQLLSSEHHELTVDTVVIATAYQSQSLDSRIFEFRKIRGQLSWFVPNAKQLNMLPKLPLKYGGYCAQFYPRRTDTKLNPLTADTPTFLLGASFVRNDTDTKIRASEHEINKDKLISAIPDLKAVFRTQNGQNQGSEAEWQARVGIRAQTPDYHPLAGCVDEEGLIWTLSGMGSKGYAFAPLCAEALVDMMTGQFCPLSALMIKKLSPQRKSLQKPLT